MNALIARLPHRAPFAFVSEVTSIEQGVLHAVWDVRGDEAFFAGHFPSEPIVPGVLIVESLAQAAGIQLLAAEDALRAAGEPPEPRAGMLVQSDIRFRRPVRPPARIELVTRVEGDFGALHRFTVEAREGGAVVAQGTLVLAVAAARG